MKQDEIKKLINSYGHKIDTKLEEIIPRESYGDVSKFLIEPVWYHMSTGGKRIRPALCLLTCELLRGNPEKALNFAAACEVMHNYFLLHDDIMDGDTIRRDSETVWAKYGVANAINCGDYMSAKGYESILKSDLPLATIKKLMDIYSLTMAKTMEGQALDVNYRGREDFTIEKYLELARLKTGYYLVCPIVGGAIISGAPDTIVNSLWNLGGNLGTAFQIRDDIIDLTEGKGRGGEIGNDIKEGKPSILFAHALSKGDLEEKEKLIEIMKKPREKTTKEDVQWVIALYAKYGTIDFAQNMASELEKQALKIIDSINFEKKDLLRDIAEFIISRQG
jgi:geranylgeranyl pyrophosphate synthase